MEKSDENLKKMSVGIPENFEILQEGIDIESLNEYAGYSHSFDRGKLSDKETINLGRALIEKKLPIEARKKILVLLAHLGTIEACRQIEKYSHSPDNDLKHWTLLALQECRMFLESSIMDESVGYISSGLGGHGNRMRYYFFVLPLIGASFTQIQKDVIKSEFEMICSVLNSIVENIDFSEIFMGFTVLVPMDVAVGTLIELGINKCNELGEFVFEYYYVGNTNIPDQKEIEEIIEIILKD
ncbi:MAG: hypothetical protein WCP85_13565 [Mariniphaga sp.]